MKKLLLFASLLLAISSFAQTIRRVNNTPGINDPNVYATAQAAHDAAVDGDTLYFEPAGGSDGVNYGELTVTKKLTLIGPGYLLDKNPNTSFDKRPVRLQNITFENGSTTTKMMGLSLNIVTIMDSLITITRCNLSQIRFSRSNTPLYGIFSKGKSSTITNCIFSTIFSEYDYTGSYNYGQNHTISNNIIIGDVRGLRLSVIKNNVFNSPGAVTISDVLNCTIFNNIFDARGGVIGNIMIEGNGNSYSTRVFF